MIITIEIFFDLIDMHVIFMFILPDLEVQIGL